MSTDRPMAARVSLDMGTNSMTRTSTSSTPSSSDDAWGVLSYVLAGMLFYGGMGTSTRCGSSSSAWLSDSRRVSTSSSNGTEPCLNRTTTGRVSERDRVSPGVPHSGA